MWGRNSDRPVEIPKLNEEMAIKLGARILVEQIMYGIAAAILIAIYVRGVKKQAKEEEQEKQKLKEEQTALKQEMKDLINILRDLEIDTIRHET